MVQRVGSPSAHQLVHKAQQVCLSQPQLSQRVRLEEEPDQPPALPVRPAAEIQVSLLRVRVQGEGGHQEAHQDQAPEPRRLCDRYIPIVGGPSVSEGQLSPVGGFLGQRSRPSLTTVSGHIFLLR
ncbi:uncharacterized protein LOC143181501 isoform X2 [Calliopsis andreniformis]|uniref:uncharacterized protein LOC143181501 isoform X2 n=1 Tax=Calliopsis andreniformis TaxID=337506 RepID=UPI003FCE10FD